MRPPTFLLLVASFLAAGCGSSDALDSPTAKKLAALATLYLEAAANTKGGAGPAEADFKKFVRTVPGNVLAANKIELPEPRDAVFASDRDGQPFVVRYGTGIGGMSKSKAPVLAHEAEGAGGKVLVVFANLTVDLVDRARLDALLAAP